MDNKDLKEICNSLIDTFLTAGERAIELRKIGLTKKIKSDNTPVTNGDLEVNEVITKKILNLTPDIPIISEETESNKLNTNLKNFWLIDPIDGTSEYINNREEFTINAALIINKKPVIGVVYAPAKKRLFYTYGPSYAFEIFNNKEINLSEKKKENVNLITAVSYSNDLKPDILKLHEKFNVSKYQRMKSSLKFCVVAACEFDLYVAEARAYEWDIAAGHALLENAGGKMTDFDGNEILYGKTDFKNPSLILKGKYIL